MYGHSKEKRSDAPLVTLGLIIDENGFPKASKIFKGNASEPETLKIILDELKEMLNINRKPIVVLDAGIAVKKNLEMIKNDYQYDYIVVSREKLGLYKGEDLIIIKKDNKNEIEAYLYKSNGENILYCKSKNKLLKEKSMADKLMKRFEKELDEIKLSLTKPRASKKYEKILERIGRKKEKHSQISHFYTINVVSDDRKIVTDINYKINDEIKLGRRFSGSYYLRTSRVDLTEKEIWNIYIMLTDVESSFKVMKSELGLRPVFHQKDIRIESHLFITVLAYHIQRIIRYKLKRANINDSLSTIRLLMSTHEISRITQDIEGGGKLHIKKCTELNVYQKTIYEALKLRKKPISDVIFVLKPKEKS